MDELSEVAFEHAPLGLIFAEERIIRRCNARFAEMFGYRKHVLVDTSLAALYPTTDEFERIGKIGVARMMGTGRYHDERIMRRRDGSLFWCRVRGQSLTPDAPFGRSVWSFADISDARPLISMTRREREVAKLMAEGLTSKEIARSLEISPRTVEAHRGKLFQKFGARNGLELVASLAGVPL